jgi:predicted dehydrogenase
MKTPDSRRSRPTWSRRQFLSSGAAAGSLLLFPQGLRGQAARPANDRLRIAVIGVGGRGRAALMGVADEQMVAFCDVDEKHGRSELESDKKFGPILAQAKGARWFKDYRLLFETMADQIDAVTIATPDHLHFPIAMAAIRHRKHVFVEKPLCRCISEVRALQAAAKAAGVVTQMGNQGRASEGIRLAREWVQAGLIGEVQRVDTWTDRPRAPWFHPVEFDPDAQPGETPVPPTLDWDLWLGPSPSRPYRTGIAPAFWRGFVDYGTGSLGDMGCHQLDAPFFALDLGSPVSVEAAVTQQYPKTFPASSMVTWSFPARGKRGPVTLRWFDGSLQPPLPVPGFKLSPSGGSLFYGTKGIMGVTSHSASVRLIPESRMVEMASALPPKSIPRVVGGHFKEWTNAIRGGPPCGSNFDYSAPLTEVVLLGVAAQRAHTRLEWDADLGRVTNHTEANRFIGPGYDYRPGWGI